MTLLTRKQQWRRQVKCIKRPISDGVYDMGITSESDSLRRCQSDNTPILDINKISRLFSTYCSLTNIENKSSSNKKQKKSVSFGKPIRIVLIPTRNEYFEAKLGENIWWSNNDYDEFRLSAMDEMNDVMRDWSLNRNRAKVFLYQPFSKDYVKCITN